MSKDIRKQLKKIEDTKKEQQKRKFEFYSIRRILGNANWAIFYLLLGAREAGKSYAVTQYFVKKWKEKGNL